MVININIKKWDQKEMLEVERRNRRQSTNVGITKWPHPVSWVVATGLKISRGFFVFSAFLLNTMSNSDSRH